MEHLDCNWLLVRARARIDPDNQPIRGNKIMTFDQILERAKPYGIGLIVGLVAAPVIGFNAGWITTTTASAQASETARVDALTGICSSAAGRMATASSTDLAALKGYDNRAKRDELVAAIMADIQVPADILDKISTSCSRSLS
ncbi:hypothetical protein BMJ34_11955 [Sinorhizobium medicae]|uniref:Uncharacterized protein n=2 Tax=Sinorhizobium medicae TaxID=110321 RepID=A0ABX4TRH7_9HYPH|nr:hypothetical protein [Sinorhizobium medicae]MDX0633574.1 hypothetical protein [Sinorhizobium medicae]MDX0694564.1 hypothetical protein [Sinorhizobium medicae]MDX0743747.1 hypothetical protein [Sinorhizobium medicae]MDX0771753.1 hypothetical protein [Sinorhizobium medicae]